jgi:hypothetical protein
VRGVGASFTSAGVTTVCFSDDLLSTLSNQSASLYCQVPSCSRPSVTGMLSWVWVSALLMWAGMSSGPSSLPGYNARQPEHAAEQDEFMRVS